MDPFPWVGVVTLIVLLVLLVAMRCTRPRYVASSSTNLTTLRNLRTVVLDVVSHSTFSRWVRWKLTFKVKTCTMVEMTRPDDQQAVAWTVDKGRALHLCLDASDTNVLLHILLHEVAHMATIDVGHTPQFYRCHRILLAAAERRGHYIPLTANQLTPFCGTVVET